MRSPETAFWEISPVKSRSGLEHVTGPYCGLHTAGLHALAPRRRKFCERPGRHAREAACICVRLFLRFQTTAHSAAFRASRRCRSASAGAPAMAGSTKGELRQPEQPAAPALDPRRRKFRERCGRRAREAACGLRRRSAPHVPSRWSSALPRRRASSVSQHRPHRTRSLHAGGNCTSASAARPRGGVAGCVRRFCAGQTRARWAAVRASCRCAAC